MGLAYIGKIIEINPIPDRDRVVQVTAVCGEGGKWKSIMKKDEAKVGALVTVFLPDAIIPSTIPSLEFMHNKRVKPMKMGGVVSDSLIVPNVTNISDIGSDVTSLLGVEKYYSPELVKGEKTIGQFPPFLSRTDEPNYQKVPEMVEKMRSLYLAATMKLDGSSTTVYNFNGKFGVCSRNLEVEEGENRYWIPSRILRDKLPDGYALQFETVGPGIQSNKLGLSKIEGYLFNVWDCRERKYLSMGCPHLWGLMQTVPLLGVFKPNSSPADWVDWMSSFTYPNGHPIEGIVVRPLIEQCGHLDKEYRRYSYKVLNPLYK